MTGNTTLDGDCIGGAGSPSCAPHDDAIANTDVHFDAASRHSLPARELMGGVRAVFNDTTQRCPPAVGPTVDG